MEQISDNYHFKKLKHFGKFVFFTLFSNFSYNHNFYSFSLFLIGIWINYCFLKKKKKWKKDFDQ